MSVFRLPILGSAVSPDISGDVFPAPLDTLLSMTNAKRQIALQMNFPTGSDVALEGGFSIPKNYVGSPKLIIKGIIDGTPANILAFGFQKNALADSESADVAYASEQLVNNSDWSGYADEDLIEMEISLTAGDYAVDDTILYKFFRDDSVDTTTFNFILLSLEFEFADA